MQAKTNLGQSHLLTRTFKLIITPLVRKALVLVLVSVHFFCVRICNFPNVRLDLLVPRIFYPGLILSTRKVWWVNEYGEGKEIILR